MANMTTEAAVENMTTEAAVPAEPNEEPFRYTDKRFMVSLSELSAAARALQALLKQDDPANLTDDGTIATEARKKAVLAVLRAINHERLGHAEGTIARNKDGRVAKRYYDRVFCCLRWLVLQNENGPVTAERLDELEMGWQIVHAEPWNVSSKFGEEPPI